MKKLLLVLGLLLGSSSAFAQISIPDSYYINRAKKQLEAEEAAKKTKVIIVGTDDGRLSYLIRDGKRRSFVRRSESQAEPRPQWWLSSENVMVPLRPSESQPEKTPLPEENDFALLLDELIRCQWTIVSVSGNADSAVYVFEKKEKKK